ncbi:DUF3078 domain-containing protein [Sphingobacterium olei]|uniref:DUF3078 domain-containing protein n=1 Tax=Sphingobacterium olei TaxID=2571155 RepID=A0A4U0P405_9SPHI|nr:DUF3078 domain-containing protein [Sphingobacterium olei]TJZ62106.1 DUF3078 domain-containing protein [Sphingobacterium olei]
MKHTSLLLFFLLSVCSFASIAQVNLKDLREKPDANIADSDTTKGLKINPINVPIPKLNLEVNYWKHWTKFGINANQASFSDNWSAGGVNSVSLGGNIWHKSDYTRDNFNFVSEIDLRYGKIKNKDQLAKKNNDRIFWDNKLAYKLAKSWALYFSFTFESQFDAGYRYTKRTEGEEVIEVIDTITSNFMAPGYFTESFGLEYKPDNTFSLRLGTGTARQTLILDNRLKPLEGEKERFGVEGGKNFKNDLAFQITANLDRNLSKNLNLKSRYNLFADYKDIGDPDHRLDATLTAKVTNLVNVSLGGIVLYDSGYIVEGEDKAKVQFSQALSLGIIYNLPK